SACEGRRASINPPAGLQPARACEFEVLCVRTPFDTRSGDGSDETLTAEFVGLCRHSTTSTVVAGNSLHAQCALLRRGFLSGSFAHRLASVRKPSQAPSAQGVYDKPLILPFPSTHSHAFSSVWIAALVQERPKKETIPMPEAKQWLR